MTTYINQKKRNSPDLIHQLQNLGKTPGICLFIDLVDSTPIKYEKPIEDWARMINNTFNYLSFIKDFSSNIVKGIGDEIMIFIPIDILKSGTTLTDYYSVLSELYSTIYNIKYSPLKEDFYNCKMAIHYCEEVYNISFIEGHKDYYGIDIDLSARLMSKAEANSIIISESYFQKIQLDVEKNNIQETDEVTSNISELIDEHFKGVPHTTSYRILKV